MKLITHNLLMCNKKGCTANNFPLRLVASKVELYSEEALMEYSKPLMQRLLEKLDINALRQTASELNWEDCQPIPDEDTIRAQNLIENEEFLQNLHRLCCSRHITEGLMVCNNCQREYPIKNGIANMLLNEDEV